MSRPFNKLSVDQFAEMLQLLPFKRQITGIDLHHTWRPNHAQFRSRSAAASIDAMWQVHTAENGWGDIAQHLTVDPDGALWTGRAWDEPPASARGHNGNSFAGPFMLELIGDFDKGKDLLEGDQRRSAVAAIALLQRRFKLPPGFLRFHNQLSPKSCPGTGVSYAALLAEVEAEIARAAETGASRSLFGEEFSATRASVRRLLETYAGPTAPTRALETADAELDEETMSPRAAAILGGEPEPLAGARSRGLDALTPDEIATLRPHVINLRLGAFSDSGEFTTSKEDVDQLFGETLPAKIAALQTEGKDRKLNLLFYAHGGLIDERDGLRAALDHLQFWCDNDVYPIYFIWETGLGESVSDIVSGLFHGSRGIVADAGNALMVALARPIGLPVWSQIKRSAQLASLPTGGALYAAQKAAELLSGHGDAVTVHAAGHSAGSIFHAYFLPALLGEMGKAKVPAKVETLHLLAPAVTTALFESHLLPLLEADGEDAAPIGRLTMYTMRRELEKADTAGPYKGSLLYFVSNAFEPAQPTPILGLEENLRREAALLRLFGLAGVAPATADLIFSTTAPGAFPSSATEAISHGGPRGFGNDSRTLGSIVRRIRVLADSDSIVDFEVPADTRELFPLPPDPLAAATSPVRSSATSHSPAAATGGSGVRRAVCIGIDQYPSPNALGGCVNDANRWAATLRSLGFETSVVTDTQATRDGILCALRTLLTSSHPGDVAVLLYAGHGTTVPDQDGDEASGSDQAICPIDFGSGALIIDDDLREIFNTTKDGVNVTCFMDCCHSGTNTRLIAGTSPANLEGLSHLRARFIRPSAELAAAHLAFRTRNGMRAVKTKPAGPGAMKQVSFAACQDSEVAFEENGGGVFTSFATRLLGASIAGVTNRQFHAQVLAAFGSPPRQSPYLDCAPDSLDRPLLQPLVGAAFAGGSAPPVTSTPATDLSSRMAAIERRLTAAGF